MRLFRGDSGDFVKVLVGHGGPVQSLSWSPKGDRLASGALDNTIRLWEPNSGNLVQTIELDGPVYTLDWQPKGSLLAYGTPQSKIGLWDLEANRLLKALGTTARPFAAVLAWSPDGQTIAANQHGPRVVKLWNVTSGEAQLTLEVPFVAADIAWSPDGDLIAVAASGVAPAEEARTLIWNSVSGELVREIAQGEPSDCIFHRWKIAPDSSRPRDLAPGHYFGTPAQG